MGKMNNYTKAELIIWLRDTISAEVEKPENEINIELVDACSKLLSELMGDHIKFSKEELYERLAKIMTNKAETKEVKRKPRFKLKRIVAFTCAAAVLACATFAVGAFNPSVRNMVLSALKLGDGDKFDESGVTYVNMGEEIIYSSVTTLINEEELDIVFPQTFPEDIIVERIIRNNDEIIIKFNDASLYMIVFMDTEIIFDESKENAVEYIYNDIISYVLEKDGVFNSYTKIDNDIYTIESNDIDIITSILSNLKGGN